MSPTPPFPPVEAACIEAELKAALPALFGAGLASTEVQKAFAYQTFEVRANDGRAYLMKIARQPAEFARLEAIARSVELARSAGIRTPAITRVAPAAALFGQRPYLLQEYWPGRDAEDAWPSLGTGPREQILSDWGREVARLHAIVGDAFTEGTVSPGQESDWSAHVNNRLEWAVKFNQRTRVLEAGVLAKAQARIQSLLSSTKSVVQPALTHRDLCLKNVLLSSEGSFSALLDFEHARMSDPLMDFVRLRLWLFESEPGTEDAFLSGYRAERPEPWPRENERYEAMLLLELLGEIPYYQRNAALAELDRAVARLKAATS